MANKYLLTLFVLVGVIARILPHLPNFAPIGAMALFGGTYFSKRQALIIPILTMIISDILIGFDSLPMRLCVYGSFMLMVIVGFWLKKQKNTQNIIFSGLLASMIFFLVTNFGVWLWGNMYPRNINGLLESYLMAIPFLKNTVLGDIFYISVFFGGYEMAKKVASGYWAISVKTTRRLL